MRWGFQELSKKLTIFLSVKIKIIQKIMQNVFMASKNIPGWIMFTCSSFKTLGMINFTKHIKIKQLTFCGWWWLFFFYNKARLHKVQVQVEWLQLLPRCQLSLLVLKNWKHGYNLSEWYITGTTFKHAFQKKLIWLPDGNSEYLTSQ